MATFRSDFLFQLTADEKTEVVANCDHLQNLKFSKTLPLRLLSTEPPKQPTGPARCPKDGRHRERPNKDMRQPDEEAPIGLILCAESSREQVELLQMHKDGITVAEYLSELPPKAELEQKLHAALLEAR